MPKAYYHVEQHPGVIVLTDLNGSQSITNDAEAVIVDLSTKYDLVKNRVIYRDSMGRYDGLAVKGNRFVGFIHIGLDDKHKAIMAAASRERWPDR